MLQEHQPRFAEDFILTSPEGSLLARAVDPTLNSDGRRRIRTEILAFCRTPERYTTFSSLVRNQLTDDLLDRRENVKSRVRPIDDLLVSEFGDPEKVRNTRLYFEFSGHSAKKEDVEEVRSKYRQLMKNAFVKGERNILVLENPDQGDFTPDTVVFPEGIGAAEFDLTLRAYAAVRVEESQFGRALYSMDNHLDGFRHNLKTGIDQVLTYYNAMLQGADDLRGDEYKIGLMYEKGVNQTTEMRQFVRSWLRLDVRGYARLTKTLLSQVDTRDKMLISQIRQYIETSPVEPTNILVVRGAFHGKMLEFLPPSYVPCVQDPYTNLPDLKIEGPGLKVHKSLMSGKEPTEEQWQAAHMEYMEVVNQNLRGRR